MPLPGHGNEADDIERIRHFRNKLAQNSDLEICDTDFSIDWTNLSQVKKITILYIFVDLAQVK